MSFKTTSLCPFYLVSGQLFTLGNPEDVPADDFVTDQDVVSLHRRLVVGGGASDWYFRLCPMPYELLQCCSA